MGTRGNTTSGQPRSLKHPTGCTFCVVAAGGYWCRITSHLTIGCLEPIERSFASRVCVPNTTRRGHRSLPRREPGCTVASGEMGVPLSAAVVEKREAERHEKT